MIDTGATITVLASDVVSEKVNKINYIVNLFGLTGKDNAVKTEGMVHGLIIFGGQPLGASFHLIERKYCGQADGYLGFGDFLSPYKALIDINNKCIRIDVNNIIFDNTDYDIITNEKNEDMVNVVETTLNINEDLLKFNALINIYERQEILDTKFTTEISNKIFKSHKEYYEAVNFYKIKMFERSALRYDINKILSEQNSLNSLSGDPRADIIYSKLH